MTRRMFVAVVTVIVSVSNCIGACTIVYKWKNPELAVIGLVFYFSLIATFFFVRTIVEDK